jgi:hypothetical protein
MRVKKAEEYDSVLALIGYDTDGNVRIVEDDGWIEQAIPWAADPSRIELRLPAAARPENRAKKSPFVVHLKGKRFTCASAI